MMNDSPRRVLIVADEPDQRLNIQQMLSSGTDRRYQFEEAELGAVAVRIIQSVPDNLFDCVLLDDHLPDLNAHQILTQLCDGRSMQPCAVIVLASADDNDGSIFLRDGAEDFLGKSSLTPDSLTRAVENAMQRYTISTERKQVEHRLRKADDQLQFIMDSMPQKIGTTQPNGKVDYINPQWTEFTGLTFEEIKDWGWTQSIHPDDVSQHVRVWQQSIESGEQFEFESRFKRADGAYRWHFSRALPMRDEAGHITMWVGSNTDVHDVKQAKAAMQLSELRYRRLFEAAKDGILILDFDAGIIVDSNPFMSDLLGYSHADFLGKELWEIGIFSDKSANQKAVREVQENGYVRFEHLPLESNDGVRVEVEVVANAYREGDHHVIQCNIRDITDRSRLEKLLQEQAIELSDLHRRKDEFLAMLSHELRSPLAPIANAVQLLGLHRASESPIQGQARGIIERQLGQLQHLVDDLLEVSRITTGRVQLRLDRIAVNGIVANAVETARPLIEQRQHELTVLLAAAPIWLHADAARLEQVVVNLLTNAAKYTPEGGHIRITIQREKDECVLCVEDTGVGISPALLPKIFDLFTQAERSLDRSQGGLGIGLALVQRLTELHGGKVEVESTLGQGSKFVVRLPILPSELAEPLLEVAATTKPPIRSFRVLVVDDNVDTVLSFSMLLRATGHEVRSAHDGFTALQAAIEFQPDVMLLDIGLPGLNGYEVAKRIRQNLLLKNVILVALTGYGQDEDRQTSTDAGFDFHVVKPASFQQVHQILTTIAEQKR